VPAVGSAGWILGLQRTAGNAAAAQAVRTLARQRRPRTPGSTPAATPAFRRARTADQFVDLIREAERRLTAAGVATVDERIQVLSGIYYATDWSLDFEVERSAVRNTAFQIYTARAGAGRDPRPILGTSLFEALKDSQDVAHPTMGKIDVGHMIIGLNSRASWASRVPDMPTQGATGLEIVTWVGDLGGATAQLARRRLTRPSAPASAFFTGTSGTDYGADSNLEGDIASYVTGATAGAASAGALTVPAGGGIADALAAYFVSSGGSAERAKAFLQMLGGTFTGTTLTNRAAVELTMATKFRDFGRWYAGQRFGPAVLSQIRTLLAAAGRDIAAEFMNWLLRRRAGASAPPVAPRGRGTAPTPAPTPETPEPDVMDRVAEGVEWFRRQF